MVRTARLLRALQPQRLPRHCHDIRLIARPHDHPSGQPLSVTEWLEIDGHVITLLDAPLLIEASPHSLQRITVTIPAAHITTQPNPSRRSAVALRALRRAWRRTRRAWSHS